MNQRGGPTDEEQDRFRAMNRPLGNAQNNTKVEMPQPRVNKAVMLGLRSGKRETLHFIGAVILFWRERDFASPLAVETGGVVYFSSSSSGATIKAVNEFQPAAPHMRVDAAQFDFIIGQVLMKTGLPLTRKEG
jgi:hypothetical protein